MNVVGNKWVYAQKFLGNDEGTWKPKARLVTKGFQQIPGIDYFETHASVVRFESLRIVCAIATMRDMEMAQDDIEKAYLNATPSETIYMEQPPGYVSKEFPDHVCLMLRALYGFMQSGNNWWEDLDRTWAGMGFSRSRADECVRARFDLDGLVISATYTDDITELGDTAEGLSTVRNELAVRVPSQRRGRIQVHAWHHD